MHSRHKNILYILKLTIGFESNLKVNSDRKSNKYKSLVPSVSSSYNEARFVNVSMSAFGVLDNSCESLIKMMKDMGISEALQRRIISEIINIAIRCTYYIFCCRNKDWSNPDLMDF